MCILPLGIAAAQADFLFRAAPVSIDQTVSDFDGVLFHISTPEVKTKIRLSIQIRCFKELVKYGAVDILQREYGSYVTDVEPGFDFSVLVDLETLPESTGMYDKSTSARLGCADPLI